MLNIIFFFLYLLNQVIGAPLPRVITRYHTADAVTNTQTVTTGTTTVYLPPVEIFISNGVTYTFTLTDQAAAAPTTFTSYLQQKQVDPQNTEAPAEATQSPTTEAAQVPTTEATQAPTTEETQAPTTEETQAPTTEATQAPTTEETQAPTTEETQAPTTEETQDPTTEQTPTSTTDSNTSTNTDSDSTGYVTGSLSAPDAIVYSPYTSSGTCKDTSTIQSDLDYIFSLGISKIRLYGTDCGTFSTILPYCKQKGISVNQGLWFSSAGIDSIDDAVSDLVSYGQQSGWDVFEYITVGNEAISDGFVSASDLISKISSVKSSLNNAGYSGEITTSEPASSFVSNPSLCADSDISFVGVNAHSYFDEYVNASQAGEFVLGQVKIVENVCGSKKAVITETGYPSAGDVNGLNIPSKPNQKIAIESILESTNGQITILTTFDDFWKVPGPYGIEQYFGAAYLFE